MNISTSVFVYVGSIVLYKRIVNANTQSIRIANADGQASELVRSSPTVWHQIFFLFLRSTRPRQYQSLSQMLWNVIFRIQALS